MADNNNLTNNQINNQSRQNESLNSARETWQSQIDKKVKTRPDGSKDFSAVWGVDGRDVKPPPQQPRPLTHREQIEKRRRDAEAYRRNSYK